MSLYDESGNLFRQVAATNGNEAELLAQAGATLQTNYAYDAMYRAKHITDGNSHTTQFGYDPVGNPVSLTHPSGLAMTWKFDPDHNINKRIDSLNQVTNYTTDTTDSRLTDVNYPSGTSPQFQYDIYDRVIHMTDATGTFTYAYDDNDLLTTVTTSYAGLPTQTISYIYNPDGSRYTMTISGLSGSIVRSITYTYQYYYDTAHQMRAVSLLSPMFPQQADICYYDLNGRLSVRDIGYVKTTYTYDPRGRLASLSNDSPTYNFRLESYYTSIVHDAAGNLTDLDYNIPYAWYYYSYFQSLTGHTHYTYDTLDRLTGEQRTCSPSTYSYNVSFSPDVADNPLSMRGQSFTYNADNQIQGYAYNGNGDCTGFGNYGLTYDYEDLPKTLTWGTNTFPMQFRADGLRASKTRGSTTTYYLYDGKRVICEVDSQGYLASAYAYGLAGLGQRGVYTSDYGLKGPYIYTFDPLGSLVKSLYMSGVDGSFNYGSDRTAIYDAFGKRWWDNNGPGNTLYPGPASFDDSVGFQGQSGAYTDPETGSSWNGTSPLILMGVRYYDPTSGRFITRDPIGDDVNDYAYCGNNPVERTDPDGLSYLGDVGGVFVGYGQTIAAVVNPVGWYHGAKALCHMTRRYGVRKAASAVWQGTKKSFTAWATTSNPKEFGQSFGNILITGAAVAAPYAKAGQIAGEAAAIGKAGEAASAADKMRLALDMALEEAESGTGDVMAKGNKIHDIARLLRKGGEPSDWEKVTAPAHELPNGTKIQYHWYQNLRTGKRYDMKMKVVTPKWPKMR